MNQLAKQATVVFLAFLMLIAVVYASYWIYSNSLPVTVSSYSLALTYTQPTSTTITLTATLTKNGAPIQSAQIHFYNETLGEVELTPSGTTDVNGVATWSGTVSVGNKVYKAGYQVTP